MARGVVSKKEERTEEMTCTQIVNNHNEELNDFSNTLVDTELDDLNNTLDKFVNDSLEQPGGYKWLNFDLETEEFQKMDF